MTHCRSPLEETLRCMAVATDNPEAMASPLQLREREREKPSATHSSSQQRVNPSDKRECEHDGPTGMEPQSSSCRTCIDDSKRWHTSPTNRMCAPTESGELWTDPGSKIQGWWLQLSTTCGEIPHLRAHCARRSANTGHSDRQCQRSPTAESQKLQPSGWPTCLAGPQGSRS